MVAAGDPGDAVVKTSPSNAEVVGSNSGEGAKILCLVAQKKKEPKKQKPEHKNNRSNNVSNSINFPLKKVVARSWWVQEMGRYWTKGTNF